MSAPIINRVVGDFKAAATRDKTIHLKELRGQNVVIYFYPKDSTPGCTLEGQDFRDLHAKFRRQKIYGNRAQHLFDRCVGKAARAVA